MQNHKKRPFAEDYNICHETIENASSSQECTGLEPTSPKNSAEKEAYSELENFYPEDIVE